ncbi:unnamed protein product [Lampetra planeri]
MCGDIVKSCWLLFTLSLKGILASDWSVHLPSRPICAVTGASVVLPCSYEYPQSSSKSSGVRLAGAEEQQQNKVLSEMWCLEESRCITPRYVFHSDGIFPDPSYDNRVQYLGDLGTKNCSLRISDLRQSDTGTYVFYLITNHTTQKMPEQRGLQLLVADSISAVTVSSPTGDITEGGTIRLACCSSVTEAQFQWYKSTRSTPSHTGQMWSISDVTYDDSGSYYCQIQTGDKVQNSSVIEIDVQYAPRNTAVSVWVSGKQDEEEPSVTLTCNSDANPPVHIYTWYQGAACLPKADTSLYAGRQSLATHTGKGRTLSSLNITAKEYGQHCCVARNRHGAQMYAVTVPRSKAETSPSYSTGVLVGVTISVLLAVMAVLAFIITRRKKSSRHRSYVLTETTATAT